MYREIQCVYLLIEVLDPSNYQYNNKVKASSLSLRKQKKVC